MTVSTITIDGVEKKLYKVLSGGKSITRGDYEWSLPAQNADGSWTPGNWHEESEAVICRCGLHTTWDPVGWCSKPDVEIYETEVDSIVDSQNNVANPKAVSKQCRLTSRVTDIVALAALHILLCGHHEIKEGHWFLSDSESAELYDSASAELYDSASAKLYGSASAKLYDSASAKLYDSASAELYDSASAELYDSASAELYDSASAELYDSAIVISTRYHHQSSTVTLFEQAVHVDRRGEKVVCRTVETTEIKGQLG